MLRSALQSLRHLISSVLRPKTRRVLFVDLRCPRPDRDAGSVVVDGWMRILRRLGYQVVFLPTDDDRGERGVVERLRALGVKCPRADGEPFAAAARREAPDCGLVVVCRYRCARALYTVLDELKIDAPRVFLPIDLHYIRAARHAALSGDASPSESVRRAKAAELSVVESSDLVCVHSTFEARELQNECPRVRTVVSPIIFPSAPVRAGFGERRGICFVGGFEHRPNVDAMVYFVREVWPLVRAEIREMKLQIVGGGAPEEVAALAAPSVEIAGHVPDLAPLLQRVRLTVAPLRYGAGVKGKVGLSLSYGVPVVGTPLAFEGMDLAQEEGILAGADAPAIAAQIVRVYRDEELWSHLSTRGWARAARDYSAAANTPKIRDFLTEARTISQRRSLPTTCHAGQL